MNSIHKAIEGEGKHAYIIAEIGNNHDGSFDKAKELVHAAKEAGVNSVKFQCIDFASWITPDLPIFARAKGAGFKTQLERLCSVQLSIDNYIELAELTLSLGLDFGCTVFDAQILESLDSYLAYRKISSGELHNLDTLRLHADCRDKPVLISTGLVRCMDDIEKACSVLNKTDLVIMHCVSTYPTSLENAALHNIPILQRRFGINRVGYSDHTVGIEACIYSLGLGVKIIEKHFKLDEESKVGDKPLSATISEMKRLTEIANLVPNNTNCDGSEIGLQSQSGHSDSWQQLVRKAHAREMIRKGQKIGESECTFIISGHGDFTSFEVRDKNLYALNDIHKGGAIKASDVTMKE